MVADFTSYRMTKQLLSMVTCFMQTSGADEEFYVKGVTHFVGVEYTVPIGSRAAPGGMKPPINCCTLV